MFDGGELAEQCGKAAGMDVSFASDAELRAAAKALAVGRAALDAAEAHVLGELEARGGCERGFGLTTASWIALETHAPRRSCRSRVRLGSQLRAMSVADQALAEGRIHADHARALGDAATHPRVGDQIAGLESELVDAAGHTPYEIWRRDLAVLVELLDQDGPYDPDRDLAANRMRLATAAGDRVLLRGELVGEPALVVAHALNQKADQLWRRFRDEHRICPDLPIPNRTTLLALALVELCRVGLAAGAAVERGPVTDMTVVFRAGPIEADEGDLDDLDDLDGVAVGSDRSDGRGPGLPGLLYGLDGAVLTRLERYAHLWCDSAITAMVVDAHGVPLDMGRTARWATPAQRRAIAVRDGGCVFPGCDTPMSWCDIHHVRLYEHGGGTDLANEAPLCRRHHGVTHRAGWTMSVLADQRFTWTTPTGQVLQSQRHRRPTGP